jgi:hypothetical protein
VLAAYGLRRAETYTTRAEAARFEGLARTLEARYARLHHGGPLGVAIVPAFKTDPLQMFGGMDLYADVATYAGLTAMTLGRLAETNPRPGCGLR